MGGGAARQRPSVEMSQRFEPDVAMLQHRVGLASGVYLGGIRSSFSSTYQRNCRRGAVETVARERLAAVQEARPAGLSRARVAERITR